MNRQTYYLRSLLLLLQAYLQMQGTAVGLRQDLALSQDGPGDVIFASGLLWVTECGSAAQCAMTCMDDEDCLSFTMSSIQDHGMRISFSNFFF